MDKESPSCTPPLAPRHLWIDGWEPAPGRLARSCMGSAAAIHALEKWEHGALLPRRTVLACIRAAVEHNPVKAAMVFVASAELRDPPRVVRYGQLLDAVRRAATVFSEAANGKRSVVGVLLPMLPESLIAVWGAQTAGIAVPINPHLEIGLVIAILQRLEATVLVTTGDLHNAGALQRIAAIRAAVPSLRRVLLAEGGALDEDFNHALSIAAPDRAPVPADDPHAEAMWMPTGGTTGAPKIVRMTHWGQLVVAWNVGALMGSTVDGVVAHGMPNFHVGGTIAIGLRAILYGQTLLTLTRDGFRNQDVVRNFWPLMRHHRVTSVLATPTTAAAILAATQVDVAGHCVTDFHCGGSPVPMELVRRFHDRFGVWLRENWGMTEVHGTVTGHPGNDSMPRVGSVGLALPHYRIKAFVLDENSQFLRECDTDERGNLVITGPSPMLGYRDPALDDVFFVRGTSDGTVWANTGDLGHVDADGYVWVSGRSKDLIIRGGHNIDPRPIEEILVRHGAVHMAAAVGRPDASRGELPIAYVELKQGSAASSAELLAFVARHTQERASVPVEIIVLPSMPVTAVGKISKPALRIDATMRVAHGVAAQVLGAGALFQTRVDDGGKRLKVLLTVSSTAADDAGTLERLRAAFENYEFVTEIVRIGIPVPPAACATPNPDRQSGQSGQPAI